MATATTKKKATRKSTKTKSTRKPAAKKSAQQDLAQDIQRPLWVAVGAVALAGDAVQTLLDDAQSFIDDALKRGEKLEAKARKEIKSLRKSKNGTVKRVRKDATKAKKTAKRETAKLSDRVLGVLDMPTQKDIQSLERKIDALAKKVA